MRVIRLRTGRALTMITVAVLTAVIGWAMSVVPVAAYAAPAPQVTWPLTRPVVTIGFDDGLAEVYPMGRLMASMGIPGVFYVNSGRLGSSPGYMTASQVLDLQALGHEIGGHTVFHLRLSEQDEAERARQICTDRNQLMAMGLRVSDFAYPFDDYDAATRALVRTCGYTSGRASGGIFCTACPSAESVPPVDRYAMRAVSQLGPDTTAAELIDDVIRAARDPGWLQFVFHRICTTAPCESNAVPLTEFVAFFRWLAAQQRAGTVILSTVRQVIGWRRHAPPVTPPGPRALPLGVVNSSLERQSADGVPECFQHSNGRAGRTAVWSGVHDAHTGSWAVQAVVDRAGGTGLMTTPDLGSCAPPITAGHRYRVGVWYKSTSPVRLIAYTREPRGNYVPYGGSPVFPPAATWTLASWMTRQAPVRPAMALSFGVTLESIGRYVLDDFSVSDAGTQAAGSAGFPAGSAGFPAGSAGFPAGGVRFPSGGHGAPTGISGSPAGGAGGPVFVPAPVPELPEQPDDVGSGTDSGAVQGLPRADRPSTPFRPTDTRPALPAAVDVETLAGGKGSEWSLALRIALALAVTFVVVLVADRRFGQFHRGTRRPPGQRGRTGRDRSDA